MANRFAIEIVALDKATKVFRNVNNAASKAFRPLVATQRSMSALAREMHFDGMAKGITKAGSALSGFAKIADGLGTRSPLLAMLGGGFSVAAGAAAFARMMANAGKEAAVATRFAEAHAMSPAKLQRLQGAAQLRGIDRDTAMSALGGLGARLQDIVAGRDPEGRMLLGRVGVKVGKNADGSPDTAKVFEDIAEAVRSQRNPEAAGALISKLGLDSMAPLLREGADGVRRLGDETEKLGGVTTPAAIKNLTAFDFALSRLSLSLLGAKNALFEKQGPNETAFINNLTSAITRGFGSGRTGGATGSWSSGGATGSWGAPLGLRLNNPGNLRSAPGVPTIGGFASFANPMAGLQAMAAQIQRYGASGINTVGGIVSKYAPPSENNTASYINDVVKRTGFGAGQALNLNDPNVMAPLLSAMVRHEQGHDPFNASQYRQAAGQKLQIEVVVSDQKTRVNVRTSSGENVPSRVTYAMPSTGIR